MFVTMGGAGAQRELFNNEFLLGNDILVAPVLYPEIRQRNIILPPGDWQDHWTKQIRQNGGF